VVVTGTPEEVASHAGSYTGSFLKPVLGMQQDSRQRVRR